ncbi:hypothetical protein BDW59DRAFT_156689 [Aspergillus cavernicola]|uniref:Uncharacterized protein n=1 Tax=Aspergillus cavernicola TaxID=176166 RepID=A0ABR4J1H8_9EURO
MDRLISGAITIHTNTDQADLSTFVRKRFTCNEESSIGAYLRDRLHDCESLERVFIMVIDGSASDPSFLNIISNEMGGLPLELFGYVNKRGPSTVVEPTYDDERQEFKFLLNYLSTGQAGEDVFTMHFESETISIRSIATLILSTRRLGSTKEVNEPMIMLYLSDLSMLPLIARYLGGSNTAWRMKRLLECPLWIYVDLFQACGNWREVWDVARRDVARRDAQAYQDSSSTLHLTRKLHRAISHVITLRENLRLHIAASDEFDDLIQSDLRQEWLADSDMRTALTKRTRDILHSLEDHHWQVSEVILEQYKTLLDLVFNTETVTQGLAVARLNYLAFAFLPLSFVAGLFGMTTFSISAAWYPLWAFVAFVLVVTAAYIGGRLSADNDNGWPAYLRRHRRDSKSDSPSNNDLAGSVAMVPTTIAPGGTPSAPVGSTAQSLGAIRLMASRARQSLSGRQPRNPSATSPRPESLSPSEELGEESEQDDLAEEPPRASLESGGRRHHSSGRRTTKPRTVAQHGVSFVQGSRRK